MAAAIYSLCAITGALCAWLLTRAYLRSRSRLLLWSSIFFAGLALNNIALWADKLVFPTTGLSVLRISICLLATLILLYGLIWEGIDDPPRRRPFWRRCYGVSGRRLVFSEVLATNTRQLFPAVSHPVTRRWGRSTRYMLWSFGSLRTSPT
jgi:Family of unknown function (DUF5985)